MLIQKLDAVVMHLARAVRYGNDEISTASVTTLGHS